MVCPKNLPPMPQEAHRLTETLPGLVKELPTVEDQTKSTPTPKTVSFELRSPTPTAHDRGYETDDSDSTVDGSEHRSPSRRRRSSHHRRSSSMPYAPKSHPSSSDNRHSYAHASSSQRHSSDRKPPYKSQEAESDSTIDLPERFDKKGRLLTDRNEGSESQTIQDFINQAAKVFF